MRTRELLERFPKGEVKLSLYPSWGGWFEVELDLGTGKPHEYWRVNGDGLDEAEKDKLREAIKGMDTATLFKKADWYQNYPCDKYTFASVLEDIEVDDLPVNASLWFDASYAEYARFRA